MGLTGTDLRSALQDEVGRCLMHSLPQPFPVNPQVLAVAAGGYQDSDGVILTIRVDGTRMFQEWGFLCSLIGGLCQPK